MGLDLAWRLPDVCSICCQSERKQKLCWIILALHPRLEQDVPSVPQPIVEALEGHGARVGGRGEHLNNADVAVLEHNLSLKRLSLLVVVEDESLHRVRPPLDQIDVATVLKFSSLQRLAAKTQTPNWPAIPLRLAIWEDFPQICDLLAHWVVKFEEDKDSSSIGLPLLFRLVLLNEDGQFRFLLKSCRNCWNKIIRSLPEAFGIAGHRSEGSSLTIAVFPPPKSEGVWLQTKVLLNSSLASRFTFHSCLTKSKSDHLKIKQIAGLGESEQLRAGAGARVQGRPDCLSHNLEHQGGEQGYCGFY